MGGIIKIIFVVLVTINASPNEQRVLGAFSDTFFNKEDAAELLGISVNGAYKLMQQMRKKGLLYAEKSGRKWIYSVNKL